MKKIALLMAIMMLFAASTSVSAAEDLRASLLASVKERIEIPPECTEFNSSTSVYGDRMTYFFEWSSKVGEEYTKNIDVTVTDSGIITNVYIFDNKASAQERPYYVNKIIPHINKETAISTAKAYLEKINPAQSGEFDFSEADTSLYSDTYSISAARKVNGIKVNNAATVRINIISGNVTGFSMNYTENAVFPALDNVMTEERAESIFRSGFLKRIYYDFRDGEMAQIVWAPTDFSIINAVSGEKFDYNELFSRNSVIGGAGDADSAKAQSEEVFTIEEQNELAAAANLISFEKAEEILRSMDELPLSEMYMQSANVSKYDNRYTMELDFEASEKWAHARLDAQSGRLLDFWFYGSKYDSETKFDDEFIAKYCKDYLSRSKVVNDKYRVRVENGIEYPANTIRCEKDVKSGAVINFSLRFDEATEFEMPEGLAEEPAIYDTLFEKTKPELSYVLGNSTEAAIVYQLNINGFGFIDAQTGKLLGYDGKEADGPISSREYAYTDISGHYAEKAIKALASIDVGFKETEFKPDSIITQQEYAALLSQCVYGYVVYERGGANTEKTADYFIRTNGLNKNYYPDEPLIREKALEYLLDAGVGEFSKAAKLNGIFKTGFVDESDIDENLLGYVAIAKGLHIVSGGADGRFCPKANITRGEAAVMLYNYLSAR